MTVAEGHIFGLLGPNGAGKSTLMRILAGLIQPSTGTAHLWGAPLGAPSSRRAMGVLPELFRYPPWLTPLEVLHLHTDLLELPWDGDAAVALLERVGLAGDARRRVAHFSKGMQQRLGLAVALVGAPRLLLLDEPTSALDPVGRHDVEEILRAFRNAGGTVLLNTHLLADVEHLADTIALIDHGHLLATGPVAQLLQGTVERWRIGVGPTPLSVRAALHSLPLAWPDGDGETSSVVFQGPRQAVPDVLRALLDAGVAVYEVEAVRDSLESWFLERLREPEA